MFLHTYLHVDICCETMQWHTIRFRNPWLVYYVSSASCVLQCIAACCSVLFVASTMPLHTLCKTMKET